MIISYISDNFTITATLSGTGTSIKSMVGVLTKLTGWSETVIDKVTVFVSR